MSETASISSGIATRYATAVFELAKQDGKIADLEKDIGLLATALADSEDFRNLISSPVYSREDMGSAIAKIAAKAGLGSIVSNTLGLMAQNRRLFVLPSLIAAIRSLIAIEKGEVTADVISAKKLTKAQETKLAAELKKAVGKDVNINSTVDEAIIGGLVVKVGSRMIDSSIASKLSKLQNVMKEVG
ncbi:MAG: F0F1 ATP synthase subunit delta [Rhodobacteraceae bacterium]|nr:F0F1 ATP synthase subunit delta [Paracoccaceae bacterium]